MLTCDSPGPRQTCLDCLHTGDLGTSCAVNTQGRLSGKLNAHAFSLAGWRWRGTLAPAQGARKKQSLRLELQIDPENTSLFSGLYLCTMFADLTRDGREKLSSRVGPQPLCDGTSV